MNPSPSRLEHLVTQMKWRLEEGNGEAIYEIGVEDNGILTGLNEADLQASLSTLEKMANRCILIIINIIDTIQCNTPLSTSVNVIAPEMLHGAKYTQSHLYANHKTSYMTTTTANIGVLHYTFNSFIALFSTHKQTHSDCASYVCFLM